MALTDQQARGVENLWKQSFPDATLLPVIGLPSNDNGVLTLTHTLGLGKVLKIDGLPSLSPLSNNALYSAENINGLTLNLYEILIPDIPGHRGNRSTAQIYVQALNDQGLSVSGVHYHWTGEAVFENEPTDHGVAAVHHQNYGLDPLEFSRRTIAALQTVISVIGERHPSMNPDRIDDSQCGINDRLARNVERMWQRAFPSASLLPVIGYPSNNNNKVAVLTHMMDKNLMKINGLTSRSPLANNALYSFECSRDKFINLYEIMIPDLPGRRGEKSTAQIYINALRDNGLDVAGVHFHWWGSQVFPQDRGVWAIHHQKVGMDPDEFSKRTIAAIKEVTRSIEERTS